MNEERDPGSNDRRKDDREWKESLAQNLFDVKRTLRDLSEDVDEAHEKLDTIDKTLRGDPENDKEGLVERIHKAENENAKFNRILLPDYQGKGGLLEEHRALWDRAKNDDIQTGYRWKFWTALVVALVGLVGLLIQNWHNIVGKIDTRPRSEIGRMVERAKHPRVRKYRVRVVKEHGSIGTQEEGPAVSEQKVSTQSVIP